MSIVYPLPLPFLPPKLQGVTLTMGALVGMSVSPFTQQQQVYQWPGQYWKASITLPPQPQDRAVAWINFLAKLLGRSGTFLLGDPTYVSPAGLISDLIAQFDTTAAQSQVINLKNLPMSVAGILKAGDYLQYGSGETQRFYRVLNDAASDGSGNAVVDVFPNVREAITAGVATVSTNCRGTFRLAQNENSYSIDQARMHGFTFAAMEAL